MAICYFSTYVKNANPSVLRFFAIDESRSVSDLLRCIALIHGWDMDTKLYMQQDAEGLTAGEIAREKKNWEIHAEEARENWLTLVLEQIPEEEASAYGTLPEGAQIGLLNWYGLNPVLKAESLRTWNLMHQEMLNERRGYIAGLGFVDIENQMVDPEDLNLRLQQQIIEGRTLMRFNMSAGEYVEDILMRYSTTNLRTLMKDLGFRTPAGMDKSLMMDILSNHFCDKTFWDSVLRDMSLEEYENLKTMVLGSEKTAFYDFPTLQDYGLNPTYNSERAGSCLPMEFLEYFQSVYQQDNERLTFSKQADCVLNLCVMIYGVFTLDQMRKVADKLLFLDCKDADLDKACVVNPEIEVLQDKVFYSAAMFTGSTAKTLYRNFKINHVTYVVPDKAELEDWRKYGYHYSAAVEREMVNSIGTGRDSWRYPGKESAITMIYRCYHLNWDWNAIQKKLIQEYRWGTNPKIYEKLKQVAERTKNDVRLVELRGYTRNEFIRGRKY